MTLTDEQVNEIKEHLLKQLDNFPEDKREQIKEQIESMNAEQVENFVEQNKLTHLGNQCIFCTISSKKTPSYILKEDDHNIAILEINPETKGHTLVLPKAHLDEIPESTRFFAQEISKKIQNNLNPTEIEINELKIMNHSILEIVPLYGEPKQKRQATKEELESIQKEILKKKDIKVEPKKEIKEIETEELFKLPPRIPR